MNLVAQPPTIKKRRDVSDRQSADSGLGIALFTPNYPGVTQEGGIGTYTKDLAHGLIGLGHRVFAVTPGSGRPVMDDGVEVRQVETRHLPIADRLLPGAGACWRVAQVVQRLVRENAIDVVEFPNWEGLGVAYQWMASVPVVVRLSTSSRESQQIDELQPSRRLRWDIMRERWQGRQARALITHSKAHRELMVEELGVPRERIEVIPLGIPTFPQHRREASGDGPPTVVFLGRMEKRKGTLDLLQAIPQVLSRVPAARFILIGSDRPHCPGGRTHAQYLADEFPAEIQRQVQLLGRLPQPEVDRWLQTADVFVAPSLYESFGLIFPEAMRWGTPVIGTRVGGIPEIVTDGETGLLVEPQQPGQLSAALVRLLADRNLRERLGAAGRKHVETHFTVERMARDTADLYASVLSAKGSKRARAAG